jgi:outer membrane lipoprotein SlyB
MESHPLPNVRQNGHHPLMILAALAVLLFCLVGIAAVLGWLPSSAGGTSGARQLSEADRSALAAGMQQPAPAPLPLQAAPAQAGPQPLAQQYAPQPAYPAQSYAAPAAPAEAPLPAAVPAPLHERADRPVQLAANDTGHQWCSTCGNIESIRTITHRAQGSGLGAGAGAILGGLLGHQVGNGNGRTLATAAGAVGGAVMGNQVEGNMHASTSYEIRVRLDDGTLRTFHQSSPPAWRTGERVRIVKGHLRRD